MVLKIINSLHLHSQHLDGSVTKIPSMIKGFHIIAGIFYNRIEKIVIPKDFPDEMHYLPCDSHKISLERHYDLVR